MKRLLTLLTLLSAMIAGSLCAQGGPPKKKIVVAYIAGWTAGELPDPHLMTHINYAFGHITKTSDGMEIRNPDMLRKVVALKQENPQLKVLLSVGGWASGNFSEMAANAEYRKSFVNSCAEAVREYGLDGIDIDWEYPTSSVAGIASSPDDTNNFTLLMHDLRMMLGKKRLLTIASAATAKYIDFKACIQYLDFVNIMAYDTALPPKHHTTLFRSSLSGRITVSEAVDDHLKAGVPLQKLCLGMPLYGRGDHGNKVLDKYMKTKNTAGIYRERWDATGQVPYLVNKGDTMVWAMENPRSIAAKCQYVIDKGLLGGMYWEITEDDAQKDLMQTVYLSLLKYRKATLPKYRILCLESDPKPALEQLLKDNKDYHGIEIVTYKGNYSPGYFNQFHAIVSKDGKLDALNDDARKELQRYREEQRGNFVVLSKDLGPAHIFLGK